MNNNIKNRIFDHHRYSDIGRLVELKRRKGLKISLAFPTYNEQANIGNEIELVQHTLVKQHPLLDEVVVIDSDSADRTVEVARNAGATVYLASEILPELGGGRGKGENLWKSLYVLKGDIIAWADADLENFHPRFVYGLIGPLLEDEDLLLVKAFYERPLSVGGDLLGSGGGRVTEILVRPIFGCFYPQLTFLFQPCAGEYAGRRSLLEKLPFAMGYGVETGLLIDIYEMYGINVIGQTNLDRRIHRNQNIESLGKMSFEILHAFTRRLQKNGRVELNAEMEKKFSRAKFLEEGVSFNEEDVQIGERPPMISIPSYATRRRSCESWSWLGTAKPYTIASA